MTDDRPIEPRPLTPDEFRRAADAYQADLVALDTRHVHALGGPLGLIHAKVEHLGSTCKATIEIAPEAAPHVDKCLADLTLYVATTGMSPQ
jgi:hypothetical protein